MATIPHSAEPSLDIREQIARIDKMQAELSRTQVELNKLVADTVKSEPEARKIGQDTLKVEQEMRLAPWAVGFTGLGAGAALFAAGMAFLKFVIG